MAWATMHFAVGMAGGAAVAGAVCVLRGGKGGRWLGVAMTLGGLWATVPDWPRIPRVHLSGVPVLWRLGSVELERWLHAWGDLFFFHRMLDAQPREHALLGLVLIILFYNAAIAWLMYLQWRAKRFGPRL